MTSTVNIDYETFSSADLRKFGAYKYASSEDTEILLAAVCLDGGPIEIWDRFATDEENEPALSILRRVSEDATVIASAHNAPFEAAISKYHWKKTFGFLPPKLEQWRCSAALCRSCGIPSSLKEAGAFLKLAEQKDAVGASLIKVFSIPKTSKKRGAYRNRPTDEGSKVTVDGQKLPVQEAWNLFREYCRKDVQVEMGISAKLKPAELTGATLEAFLLDMRMNDRGVKINTEAVARAEKILDEYTERLGQKFRDMTGLDFTQRDKVFSWFKERGYPGTDLTSGTVGRILAWVEPEEDEEEVEVLEPSEEPPLDASTMTPEAREALEIRSLLTYAAVKKLPTMRKAACEDGRVRGVIMFWGADRTGRSSSKIVQLQNLKRAVVKNTHDIYDGIADGTMDLESLEFIHGDPMKCIASCIRHFIDPGEGQQILSADYSQIEARVLPWLAGHEELLEAFRQKRDLYKVTAEMLWGIPYDKVTKEERFVGKVASLSLGFMGGWRAFLLMGRVYGCEFTKEEAVAAVKAYRTANQPIKAFWKAMGDSAVKAIETPGVWVAATPRVHFIVTRRLGFPTLLMRLPSGRFLTYPFPEVRTTYRVRDPETDEWHEIARHQAFNAQGEKKDGVWVTPEISFHAKVKGKSFWGRCKTHGGVFSENVTQATACDIMWAGAVEAEKKGYDILFPVHDELVTEYHPERGESPEGLVECLKTLPHWAKGFPIDAVGGIYKYYTKD